MIRKVQGKKDRHAMYITIPSELDAMFRNSEFAIVEILPTDDGFSVRPAKFVVDCE